jgi:hypothetical protein
MIPDSETKLILPELIRKMRKNYRMRYENSSNRWNLEGVFWAEISPDFLGDFRPSYTDEKKKLVGSRRKMLKAFRLEILLSCSIDFRSSPAGTGPCAFTCVQSYFVSIYVLQFFLLLFIRAFLDVHISHGSNIMYTTEEYYYNTKGFFFNIL